LPKDYTLLLGYFDGVQPLQENYLPFAVTNYQRAATGARYEENPRKNSAFSRDCRQRALPEFNALPRKKKRSQTAPRVLYRIVISHAISIEIRARLV
jgi:hypothetical protein